MATNIEVNFIAYINIALSAVTSRNNANKKYIHNKNTYRYSCCKSFDLKYELYMLLINYYCNNKKCVYM